MALTDLDRTLIARCLRRDVGAWNDFVDRFVGLFIHVVELTAHSRSVSLQRADRDDVVAEIFKTILEDDFAVLRRFEQRAAFATYLTVIARRIAVREVARRRREQGLSDAEIAVPSEETRVDNRDLVEALLRRLDDRDAQVVRMFHQQGRSYGEIATKLGLSASTIGAILTRARKQMERIAKQQSPRARRRGSAPAAGN